MSQAGCAVWPRQQVCALQVAAAGPPAPESVLTEPREVVQLFRSPGLAASAAASLLRKVRAPRWLAAVMR